MQLQWAHAVVYVHDMDNMLDFYTKTLGFEVADRGPIAENAPDIVFLSQVPSDHHQLAFIQTRKSVEPSNSVNHFAFRVAELGDVRGMITLLEADGRATALNPMSHGNAWSIYFQDPESNGIEVFCDTPYHVAQPQGKTWDPALSDAELLAWTQENFQAEPEFGPIDEFYSRRAKELSAREEKAQT